jgi:tripartite ATP-independent transporter DctP family solute receptor
MLKKIFCVVLVLVMIASFAACSTTTPPSSSAPASTSASTETSASTALVSPAASASTSESKTTEFPEMTLKFSTVLAENDVRAQGNALFKKLVEEATNGKVKIEIYYNATLFAQDQECEAMMKGNLDLNNGWFGFQTSYMPELGIFDAAYLFKNLDHFHKFFESDSAQKLFDRIADKIGIRYLAESGNGLRTINLDVDKKVTSRADLKDIKLRVPNTKTFLFAGQALGANPVPLGGADMYLGLQTGTIDGQDNAVATIKSMSLFEVTKSVTITGHMISAQAINIRESLWKTMSPELQKIFVDAAKQACKFVDDTALNQKKDDIAFLEGKGMKIYELTDEELSKYRKEVVDYYFADANATKDWDMDLYKQIQDIAK